MSKNPVLVNNPFFEETDDKFRKIFFGNASEKKNTEPRASNSGSSDHANEVKNTPEYTHKKTLSAKGGSSIEAVDQTQPRPFDSRPAPKRLERHNFKIYNTQIRRLQEVAHALKDHRGDDVKADMSGILRYLIDSLDDEEILEKYPSRP